MEVGGVESSKHLIMAWSFWWPALPRRPPRVVSLKQKHSYCPQNSKGFGSSVSGTRNKDQILEQKMFLVLLSLEKFKGFRSSVPGTGGREQYAFFIFHRSVWRLSNEANNNLMKWGCSSQFSDEEPRTMKLSRWREGKKQNLKPTIFTLENQVANLTDTYELPILMRLMNSQDTKASWSHNSEESTFIKDFM